MDLSNHSLMEPKVFDIIGQFAEPRVYIDPVYFQKITCRMNRTIFNDGHYYVRWDVFRDSTVAVQTNAPNEPIRIRMEVHGHHLGVILQGFEEYSASFVYSLLYARLKGYPPVNMLSLIRVDELNYIIRVGSRLYTEFGSSEDEDDVSDPFNVDLFLQKYNKFLFREM